jgi:hypothetical protein
MVLLGDYYRKLPIEEEHRMDLMSNKILLNVCTVILLLFNQK